MEILIWLLLVEAFWLAAFPTLFLILRSLPDRGYSFGPVFGLLFGSYAVWLASSFGLPFNPVLSWLITLLVFGGLNGWLLWRRDGVLRKQLVTYFRARWRLVLIIQVIFLVGFFLLLTVRLYLPEIRGQEKFSDYVIYQGLMHSQTMPPDDLWLSGFKINYYYFGYFIQADLAHLSGIESGIVYNLYLATIFAMTAIGAFGVGYGLFNRRHSKKAALAVGLLTTLFICLIGNLDTVRQLARPGERDLGYCSGVLNNTQCFWWTPTRVIYELRNDIQLAQGVEKPFPTETVNEFPFFSFLLGDIHPHLIAYPFLLFALGLALNLWASPGVLLNKLTGSNLVHLGLIALLLGATYCINTWNYPTSFVFIACALVWQQWRSGKIRWWWSGLCLGGLLVVSLALFAPFQLNFRSFSGQLDVPPVLNYPLLQTIGKNISVVSWEKTSLGNHLLIFGLFDFCVVSFLVIKLRPYFKASLSNYQFNKIQLNRFSFFLVGGGLLTLLANQLLFSLSRINILVTLTLGLVALIAISWGVFLMTGALMPRGGQRLKWLMLVAGWFGLGVIGVILKAQTLGPLLIALMLGGLLVWYERPTHKLRGPLRSGESFCLFLIFLAAAILLALELFYLRDSYENRGNSIFKYYVQIWILFSLAAAYGLVRVAQASIKFKPGYRVMWSVGALLLISFSLFYPVLGIVTRTYLFAENQGLNGELWLEREYPADYAAIKWLRQQADLNAQFRAPILEIAGQDFTESARVSTFSGFPTLVGWAALHENLWRAYDPTLQTEVQNRFTLANNYLYRTDDSAETERILRRYNIKYVFVGALERSLKTQGATEAQLNKFAKFMHLVYDKNNVQIYAFS